MIDRKAFRSLSSGLYLITAKAGDARCGCVVNTLVQVASEPATLSVSLNKENATTAAILESGRFAATVLAEDTPMELIGTFGFHTSADTDKFAACASAVDGAEVPYVTEHGLARFSVRVTETIDVGSHYLFVGVVEEAEVLSAGDPLTYAYYHAVKGGKTPPKAATYNNGDEAAVPGVTETAAGAPEAGKKIAWRCTICGYIEEGYPGGLHVPHLRRSPRDVRARGAVVPGLEPKKPPDDLRRGAFVCRGLRRAYSVPLRQSSKPSITSAWVRSTSGRCFSAASYSPAYSASETSVAQS